MRIPEIQSGPLFFDTTASDKRGQNLENAILSYLYERSVQSDL